MVHPKHHILGISAKIENGQTKAHCRLIFMESGEGIGAPEIRHRKISAQIPRKWSNQTLLRVHSISTYCEAHFFQLLTHGCEGSCVRAQHLHDSWHSSHAVADVNGFQHLLPLDVCQLAVY